MKKIQITGLWMIFTTLFIAFGCVKDFGEDNINDGSSNQLTRSQDEGKFYYAYDEKIYLEEVGDDVVVTFDKNHSSDVRAYIQAGNQTFRKGDSQVIEKTSDEYFVLSTGSLTAKKTLTEDLIGKPGIKSVNPLYEHRNSGLEMIITDEIVVKFKTSSTQGKIEELNQQYGVTQVLSTELHQVLSVPVEFDPLEVANAYQLSGLVEFSHPNFISKITLDQILPSDQYFSNQFYLHNTGQLINGRTATAGAHINAPGAWAITKGSSNIIIAVLDEGVTSDHPDLPNSRQVRLNGSNFGDGNRNDPSPIGDSNHGNACAGIIAASHNNEGIAGIAPNCKIMPVRIFRSDDQGLSYDAMAGAIAFAKNNGADIISNSWSYPSRTGLPLSPNEIPVIANAIKDAMANGRNGKGCVVVFSAGNTADHPSRAGIVNFPANIPGVITVGASDRNDMQTLYSPTSVLNSNYNQIVDIVAPSHRAYSSQDFSETFDVWSIDIPGERGYNPVKSEDSSPWGFLPIPGSYLPSSGTNYTAYTGHFGGTSAACPQVAGVAALILSKNISLTKSQVAQIIFSSARKANQGIYSYQTTSNQPYGTWNSQMGYGVLNAYYALLTPSSTQLEVSGPTQASMNNVVRYYNAAGLRFSGYSITPGTYTVRNIASDHTSMDVVFTAGGQYTLEARFSLPNGGIHTTTKYISVTGTTGTPVIRGEYWMDFASFRVDNPPSGVNFQWEINGSIVSPNNWQILVNRTGTAYHPSNAVQAPSGYYPDRIIQARCRTSYNGTTTAWSNTASVTMRGGNWVFSSFMDPDKSNGNSPGISGRGAQIYDLTLRNKGILAYAD